MTTREMLNLVRSELRSVGKLRYKSTSASGVGAADGTTIVSTGLGGVDDAWNQAEVRITSGNADGQRREVADWDNASSTLTVVEAFTHQIASAVTFEVGEKGFVSDHQIIEFLNEAQKDIPLKVVADAFIGFFATRSISLTAGVGTVPDNFVGEPFSVKVDDIEAVILRPEEEYRFTADGYLGTATDPVVLFRGASIIVRPTSASTAKLEVVPNFADMTFASDSSLPAYMHILQVKYAVMQGAQIGQRSDLYQIAQGEYLSQIAAINQKYSPAPIVAERD